MAMDREKNAFILPLSGRHFSLLWSERNPEFLCDKDVGFPPSFCCAPTDVRRQKNVGMCFGVPHQRMRGTICAELHFPRKHVGGVARYCFRFECPQECIVIDY